MAQEDPLYDDMDRTPGARTVPFAFDGESYEINLSPDNADAFKAMLRPYLQKARVASATNVLVCLPARLNHATGALNILAEPSMNTVPVVATATGPGEYLISRSDFVPDRPHLAAAPELPPSTGPRLSEVPPAPAQGAPPSATPDTEVRAWGNRWSVPGIPARGKVPASLRAIYDAFHNDNQEPWKKLLLEHDIDPVKAAAKARALTAVDSKNQPTPTQEELDRRAAERVGKLSTAQLTRLRRMFNAEDGRATSDGKDGTSFEALANRGCCILVVRDELTSTYEITNAGRLWFEVRNIDPVGT